MLKMRITLVQMDPKLKQVGRNLEHILRNIKTAKTPLVLFPECALTGYGFESKEEALACAETVPGPSTTRIAEACRAARIWAVVGLLERRGGKLFNAAVLIGPRGIAGVYRKMHLPFLGVDRFATPGDLGFPVFRTPLGKLGLLICYDGGFPEAVRSLKLGGAQLVCMPTNWPMAAEIVCRHSPIVRAQENHVNFAACNRAGTEAGFRFRGGSSVCDYNGNVVARAGAGETVLTATLDMRGADRNRVVIVPGRYELDRIAHRRPEFYGRLVKKC